MCVYKQAHIYVHTYQQTAPPSAPLPLSWPRVRAAFLLVPAGISSTALPVPVLLRRFGCCSKPPRPALLARGCACRAGEIRPPPAGWSPCTNPVCTNTNSSQIGRGNSGAIERIECFCQGSAVIPRLLSLLLRLEAARAGAGETSRLEDKGVLPPSGAPTHPLVSPSTLLFTCTNPFCSCTSRPAEKK